MGAGGGATPGAGGGRARRGRAPAGALVPGLTTEELIELADHGVGADYLRELREAGLTDLTVAELTELFDHGVQAGYIREMRDAGYGHLSAAELTELFDHGVQPDYLREMEREGVRGATTPSRRGARAGAGGGQPSAPAGDGE